MHLAELSDDNEADRGGSVRVALVVH